MIENPIAVAMAIFENSEIDTDSTSFIWIASKASLFLYHKNMYRQKFFVNLSFYHIFAEYNCINHVTEYAFHIQCF